MLHQNTFFAPLIEAETMKTYPHRKPRLVKGKKRWYINFGVYDCLTEKIVTKKYYKEINDSSDNAQRERIAKKVIREINQRIQYWALNKPENQKAEPIKPKEYFLLESIQYILDLKYSDYKDTRKTSHTFTSNANKFIEWCKNYGYSHININTLRKDHVQSYIDHMVIKDKLSGQTVENRISSMRAIFNHLIKRNILEKNVFSSELDMPKIIKSRQNHAYSLDQIQEIKQHCETHDLGIWKICQFIYYTYMRPVEIGRLKVSNVILENNQIYIDAKIAKNGNEAFIFLPPTLAKILREHLEHDHSRNDFLFSRDFLPGPKQVGYNFFGNRYKKVTEALKYEKHYTLYSWKHTGVVQAYKNGVDIKAIQMQCRHSSISQTDTYLKSLGFMDNESFRTGIPEI